MFTEHLLQTTHLNVCMHAWVHLLSKHLGSFLCQALFSVLGIR